MAFPPVPFQEWFLRQTSTGNAALNAYVARVKADGGVVEAIGCVPLAVWDWTAPSYVGLLDLFPNAAAAYSLRKLRAAYSGSAVRVRKEVSSVSSETDIGFLADGSLDTTSLLAFASDADSGDVFVVTWYDQSLSNDATQSTAANQPKIVSGGSLVEENGKAAIDFDNSDDFLDTTFAIGSTSNFASFTVATLSNLLSLNYIWDARDGATDGIGLFSDPFAGNRAVRTRFNAQTLTKTPLLDSTQYLYTHILNPSLLEFYVNSGTAISGTPAALNVTTNLRFGRASYVASGQMNGNIQEAVFYTSDQSTNRTSAEGNIANFYGITLP